jgi:chemotaxis protein methyltransferase CheR
LVELRQQNLLDIGTLAFEPDIVLMRNVLIYFDPPVRRTILDNVRRQIAPDGALLLGAAESLTGLVDGWDTSSEGHTSYYRRRP